MIVSPSWWHNHYDCSASDIALLKVCGSNFQDNMTWHCCWHDDTYSDMSWHCRWHDAVGMPWYCWWHDTDSNTTLPVTCHYQWHDITSDMTLPVTLHCQWHDTAIDLTLLVTNPWTWCWQETREPAITVIDVNDELPQFDRSTYQTSIPEVCPSAVCVCVFTSRRSADCRLRKAHIESTGCCFETCGGNFSQMHFACCCENRAVGSVCLLSTTGGVKDMTEGKIYNLDLPKPYSVL